MRSAGSVLLSRCLWVPILWAALPAGAATFSFEVSGGDAGAWPEVLASLGLMAGEGAQAGILVIPAGVEPPADWQARADRGAIIVVEGASPLAAELGFRTGEGNVTVRSVIDVRAPDLAIVWEDEVTIPRFTAPPQATVFAKERWEGVPLVAGYRRGAGAILWVATPPGARGYSRYPYLPQALVALGFEAPFRSPRLWAFFDSAYRARVDLDYFAPRWREAGISALHVATWHYWERDAESDAYLQRLIEACHRNAIQVYAWFELPHVSDRFWQQHPEWREKTALGQDAQLDWRKLMNLTNRDAFAAVSAGVRDLVTRFDWDGVNLAELYFESLEGYQNPARFTPFNADVRAEFQADAGFDPRELFNAASERSVNRTAAPLARFLDFRAELARRQQTEWIGQIEGLRAQKPWLDLVLTHVDDRFDTTMREKIGADTSKTLPLLASHDFTFLVEDPATIWDLGPQRYPQIAARYREITPRAGKLAIDINVVERYQDVYPTKQQTGTELFALVHTAAAAFPRVALYFESSIAKLDWPLLAASASAVERMQQLGDKLAVTSPRGVEVAWSGPAMVDGRPWPVASDRFVWLPPGSHSVQPTAAEPPLRLLDLNASLRSAAAIRDGIEFSYESSARALAVLDRPAAHIEIDGIPTQPDTAGAVLILPRGQHIVTIKR